MAVQLHVRAGEIVIERGVFHRQRRIIPFSRVQDVAIEQRLLARLFGTAKVKIETGGSAADEGHLDMIALADAHALRDLSAAATAMPTAPTAAGEPVLFAINFARLLHSGLFNFSLLFLAAIVAALQYLDQFGLVRWRIGSTPERAGRRRLSDVCARPVLIPPLLLLGRVAGLVRTSRATSDSA